MSPEGFPPGAGLTPCQRRSPPYNQHPSEGNNLTNIPCFTPKLMPPCAENSSPAIERTAVPARAKHFFDGPTKAPLKAAVHTSNKTTLSKQ